MSSLTSEEKAEFADFLIKKMRDQAGEVSGSSVISGLQEIPGSGGKVAGFDLSSLKDLYTQFEKLRLSTSEYVASSGGLAQIAANNQTALFLLTGKLGLASDAVRNTSEGFKSLKDGWGQSAVGAYDVAESYGVMASMLPKSIQPLVDLAQKSELLSAKLKENAVASGQLDALYEKTNGFKNMSIYVAAYTDQIAKVIHATNNAPEVVIKYAAALDRIPGAYNAIAQGSKLGIESNSSFLSASLTMAKGVGMSQEDLLQTFKKLREGQNLAFDKPGNADKALEFIASVSKASSTLGIDQRVLRENVLSGADAFKYYGNNAQGAVRGITELAASLEKTGLSGQNALTMAQNFTGAISQMTTAQKAYLSQVSGGPGGAFGAFQIDKLLRENKVDEVMKMTMDALKEQMGGELLTEEDVVDEGTAQKFEFQKSFLKDSIFGQVAKSDEEAAKLAGAMAKADRGDKSSLIDYEAATKEAYQRGRKEEDRTRTPLNEARAAAFASQAISMQSGGELMQALSGNETAGGILGHRDPAAWKTSQIERAREAVQKTTDIKTAGPISESTDREVVVSTTETALAAMEGAGKGVLDSLEGTAKSIGSIFSDKVKESGVTGEFADLIKSSSIIDPSSLPDAVKGAAKTGLAQEAKEKEKAQQEATSSSTPSSIMFECPSCHAKQITDLKKLIEHLSSHGGAVKGAR